MRIDRREADKPHPSMDVDGDGTVSAFDLKLAKRFDDDGNGILDEEETANLRAMMAKQNVKDIATMMDASGKTDQDFEAIKKNILQGGKGHKGLMLSPSPPRPHDGGVGTGEQSELQEADKHLTGEEVMLMRNAFAAVDGPTPRKTPRDSGICPRLPAVSWPWVPACGPLDPPRRDGEKTGKNGGKMGEVRPSKTCEQGAQVRLAFG